MNQFKPILSYTPENRAKGVRRDTDSAKNYRVRLIDIDQAIKTHLEENLTLVVEENDEQINVPILYGSPERWKAARKDGFLRDHEGLIQVPLLMYKRNSIGRNDSLAMFNRYVNYIFSKTYSKKNRYDRFSAMNGVVPTKELYSVTMPDYVNISYEVIVWTEYVEQMNEIIEQIHFSVDEYWGDKDGYKFKVRVDDYNNITDVSDTEQRMVRTEFTMLVAAYILPENAENEVNTDKIFTPKRVVVTNEFETENAFQYKNPYPKTKKNIQVTPDEDLDSLRGS